MVGWLSRRLACLIPRFLRIAAPTHSAQADGIFAQIKQRGTFVVATEALYNPFEFVQDGKIVGYDEDLLHAIVAAWGVKLQQLDVPFSGILVGLDQRKYDFICTAMIMNEARVTKYAFTQPVAAAPVALMRRVGDTKIKSIDDLSGVAVGTARPRAVPRRSSSATTTRCRPRTGPPRSCISRVGRILCLAWSTSRWMRSATPPCRWAR